MSTLGRLAALGGAAGLALAAWGARGWSNYSFRGRTVLITGGSRGLGLVIARELAREGAQLAIVARDGGELERAARELTGLGAEVLAFSCDVRNPAECEQTVARVIGHFGRIDALVNNAGTIQTGPLEHMEVADFENAMATHFWGPLHLTMAAAPHMRRQGGGRIINIASIGGLVAVPHLAPYCASKFALVGLSDSVRAELSRDNIQVTTVCPGLLRTGAHYNSLFKGHHRAEFAWFAVLDSLPFTSISAERTARQIIEASRRGRPHLTVTTQARFLSAFDALVPNLSAQLLKVVDRLLPAPNGIDGNAARTGWDSRSPLVPSILTRLSDRAAVQNNELRGHEPVV